ncbi:MAG TPA: lytic transglycosylase domain-containing protein [Thermoanaerobaculia bacterium]|nr:lytic transglycosylase domain-containing protein [Thermoanaerobaculia bacterium]
MTASTLGREARALAAALALLAAGAARAELVVLVDGGVLKVESVEVRGEEIELELRGGGTMILPLLRVERVVDDEIAPAPAAPPVAAGSFSLRFAEEQPRPESPWGEVLYEAARRHGLNPALLEAVARAESAFDPRAVSPRGARGLMQLMPATGSRFGVSPRELFDPEKNVDAGARYLAWLADRFDDDLPRVLAGYNAGEGTVDRFGGVPPYRETRDYVRRISEGLGLTPSPVSAAR